MVKYIEGFFLTIPSVRGVVQLLVYIGWEKGGFLGYGQIICSRKLCISGKVGRVGRVDVCWHSDLQSELMSLHSGVGSIYAFFYQSITPFYVLTCLFCLLEVL